MSQFIQQQRDINSLPGWFIFLRGGQGGLSLFILVLSTVAASKFLDGADPTYLVTPYPGFGFCWFALAWTTVYLPLAIFVIPRFPAKVKPLIFLFVFDCLSTLWWLVAFALLADNASTLNILITRSSTGSYYSDFKTGVALTSACAALGAAEFVMFAMGVVFVGLALFRKNDGSRDNFVMQNPAIVHEFPKEAQPQVPYPTTGSELSATRSP